MLYVEKGSEVADILDAMAKSASPPVLDNAHGGFADRPTPTAEESMVSPEGMNIQETSMGVIPPRE